ncbi:MAG: hypothetical protein M1834_009548 [Cirrosporium novae-zelandiae]|nr:MAG: hypothetical protein M1834_009548 [Cirrosporium novae-zelandiae]
MGSIETPAALIQFLRAGEILRPMLSHFERLEFVAPDVVSSPHVHEYQSHEVQLAELSTHPMPSGSGYEDIYFEESQIKGRNLCCSVSPLFLLHDTPPVAHVRLITRRWGIGEDDAICFEDVWVDLLHFREYTLDFEVFGLRPTAEEFPRSSIRMAVIPNLPAQPALPAQHLQLAQPILPAQSFLPTQPTLPAQPLFPTQSLQLAQQPSPAQLRDYENLRPGATNVMRTLAPMTRLRGLHYRSGKDSVRVVAEGRRGVTEQEAALAQSRGREVTNMCDTCSNDRGRGRAKPPFTECVLVPNRPNGLHVTILMPDLIASGEANTYTQNHNEKDGDGDEQSIAGDLVTHQVRAWMDGGLPR